MRRGLVLLALLGTAIACQTGCTYEPVVLDSQTIVGKYNGTVSVTLTGKTCCNWTTTVASAGVVAGTNYCRNNLEDTNVYCYAGNCNNPVGEYCDVGSFGCPICTNPTFVPTPSGRLSYPCIAAQALADTGETFETRVVGGRNAIPHEFPFFASIQRSGSVYCGGSLIHKDWIMTAQHCTFESDGNASSPSVYTIKIGLQNVTDTDSCVEIRSVTQIIRAPNYDSTLHRNDLAFFKLNASSNYPPIILNRPGLSTEDLEATSVMMTLIGFGKTQTNGATAFTLQKSAAPVVNHTECKQTWSPYVDDTSICAGYQYGTVDACNGDSGGPLLVKRGTNFIQIGATSFGSGCAKAGYPGVYMRLSSFHSWLCGESGLPAGICERNLGTPSPTISPTTRLPTTLQPTKSPTTRTPTKSPTRRPTTRSPTTRSPTTRTPTKSPTRRPTTRSPTTRSPTTRAPTKSPTFKPTTRQPTTRQPTSNPTTRSPTLKPTTRQPTTRQPTSNPTTRSPTLKPTTRTPTTRQPTRQPTTRSPTLKPTTRTPTTRQPTLQPTTRSPTLKPTTRQPTTRQPTLSPTTRLLSNPQHARLP